MQDSRIRLNVDAPDQACELSSAELFQQAICDDAVRKIRAKCNGGSDAASGHVHNAIFIDGPRGAGKTTLLLNLASRLKKPGADNLHYCIGPVDPTLLYGRESDLLSLVIGLTHQAILDAPSGEEKSAPYSEEYGVAFRAVAKSLESGQTAEEVFGLDRLTAARSSTGLEKRVREYVAQACRELKCECLVLMVDDIDMSLECAYLILDTLRRFLSISQVIPVITGDIRLYQETVRRSFLARLAGDDRISGMLGREAREQEGDRLWQIGSDLSREFLRKVLPTQNRYALRDLNELSRDPGIVLVDGGKRAELRYDLFLAAIRHLLFRGTNGLEHSHPDIAPGSPRELAQLLERLREVRRNLIPWGSRNEQEVHDWVRSVSSGQRSKVVAALGDHWRAVGNWPLFLVAQADIDLLRVAEHDLLPLRDIALFDPRQQNTLIRRHLLPESEDFHAACLPVAERHKNELWSPLGRTLLPYPAFEPFMRDQAVAAREVAQVPGGAESLLLKIYTHKDYYSSHQSGWLLFFGKAFELVVTSMFRDIDRRCLRRIINEVPYHSYFDYFPTKTVGEGRDGDGDGQADVSDRLYMSEDMLAPFCVRLAEWRQENGFVQMPPSAQLIYKAFNKLFTQLIGLKESKILSGRSLHEVNLRFKYILLNAFGSFERMRFNGERVVVGNIASGHSIDNITKDNAYALNIAPLLKQESVTRALAVHPLFTVLGECGKGVKLTQHNNTAAVKSRQVTERLKTILGADVETIRQWGGFKPDSVWDGSGRAEALLQRVMADPGMREMRPGLRSLLGGNSVFAIFYRAMAATGQVVQLDEWLDEK